MATSDVRPFICLNMIVKNESRIICRLLNSALPIIDAYCICDTGSTDNTIELINSFFTERKIPGEVFVVPFRDFGFNRTKALERAEKWGQYALLLDADMLLEISPSFKKSSLVHDVYQIKQKNSSLDYFNTRLVRTDKGITCECVTHEYYDTPPGVSNAHLDTLEINDIGDGGCKSDKFERDIRLLKKGLMDEPRHKVRYSFYLANSLRDLATMTGDSDKDKYRRLLKKAIKWYKRRLELGGWDEEQLMCCLEIGNIYRKLGKDDRAVYWWLEGYMYRKTRSETLYEIIKYYREKDGRHAPIAGIFCEIAKKIPYPKTDALFIHKAVYDYLIDYEDSILSYYMGWEVDHHRYLNLIGKHDNYNNVLGNYQFYAKKLSSLRPERISLNDRAMITCHKDNFYPSTPSVIPFEDGYLFNQRYVNYYIEENGSYTCNYPITSFNRRFKMDRNFNVISQFDFDKLPENVDKYAGIEDVKIFPYNGKVIFFGTEQDMTTKNLCVAGGLYPTTDETHALTSIIYQSPTGAGCEKNWCYLEHKGVLKVVYKWHPLTIGELHGNQIKITHTDGDFPAFVHHLRGSSNGFTFGDEIWFVTHMVEYSSPRKYYHCLIILDSETLKFKRNSILFKFEDTQIEYCLGMVVEEKRLIFGFSKMDRETIICSYARPEIDRFIF